MKPPMVQPSQTVPTAPLRVKHAPSPVINSSTNPLIWVVHNKKNTNPNIPTVPKPALQRPFQHYLRWALLNIGTIFHAQAAQNIVTHYMLNLQHTFHIYNKQSKKQTSDAYLVGKHSNTWQKEVGNKLKIITNEMGNQIRATNTINSIQIEELPQGCTVTYASVVCD